LTIIESKLPNVGTTIFTHMSALAASHKAVNLSQGFPDFDGPDALRESLAHHVMAGHNQYPPMAGVLKLRQQLALQLEHYHQVNANPETEITVVPGATEGIFCAITAIVRPGDEVIVLDPCYDSYEPGIELAGGRAVHVPLSLTDFSVDWQRVEASVSASTRAIIVNSPHNPSGMVFSSEDVNTLAEIANRHDLLVISDEVYEHLLFDGRKHHCVLAHPGLRERSFAVFSFGKTFSVTGWKTGYCVAPPALTTELRKVHQFVAFVGVTPVQMAVADFLEAQPEYPGTLAKFYQQKRDVFCQAVAGSRFKFTPSAGTYFQLLDYSAISNEEDTLLAERWTEEIGLASIPVSVFYQQKPGTRWLRFCFAKDEVVLKQAGEILCQI